MRITRERLRRLIYETITAEGATQSASDYFSSEETQKAKEAVVSSIRDIYGVGPADGDITMEISSYDDSGDFATTGPEQLVFEIGLVFDVYSALYDDKNNEQSDLISKIRSKLLKLLKNPLYVNDRIEFLRANPNIKVGPTATKSNSIVIFMRPGRPKK